MIKSTKELVLLAGFIIGMAGCSSSADEDDINANNNSENGANIGANNAGNKNANNNTNNNNLGEGVNNATKNEFVNDNGNMGKVGNAPPPISNSTNSLLTDNPSLNSPLPNNIPTNSGPPPANGAIPPAINAAVPLPAPVGPPVTGYGPDGRGKVRYVKRPIQKFSKPGQGPVGTLDTGDHPLVVKEENQWNQLSNGTFVDQQELSDEGIGRPRKSRIWQ